MASFSSISTNCLDKIPFQEYFLLAYPGYLVICKPRCVNQRLVCPKNSYIPIYPFQFIYLFLSIKNIFEAITKRIAITKLPMMKKTDTGYEVDYEVDYEVTSGVTVYFTMNHPDNKTQIKMTKMGFQLFSEAFQQLLLTPFNFPTFVIQGLNNLFLKTIEEKDLIELNSETVVKFASMCLPEIKNKQSVQLFANIMLRHKSLIIIKIKTKQLLVMDTEKIFVDYLTSKVQPSQKSNVEPSNESNSIVYLPNE